MKSALLPLVFVFGIAISACTSSAAAQPPSTKPVTDALQSATQPLMMGATGNQNASDLTRTDEQGMVVVQVTPLNLKDAAGSLDFEVAMNTHSVNLSMDLAQLATLSTDAGVSVQATQWDATPGGHHVSGKLIFPATKDGKGILEGASKLTLTIVNVDAPTRLFEWSLK